MIVEQKGIDVVASLFAPDGTLITAVDNPNGSNGAEPVHITAEATGTYRIEVTSFEKGARPGSLLEFLDLYHTIQRTYRGRQVSRGDSFNLKNEVGVLRKEDGRRVGI